MRVSKWLAVLVLLMAASGSNAQDIKPDGDTQQYKLLATTRTSTMQKEINQAAGNGYRIVVGAPTSGSEMVLFLSREGTAADPFEYKLLATTRTGTMQKELNEAAAQGYRLIPSTMIPKKGFMSGEEIVLIMERGPSARTRYDYQLLATTRTSTMQKEVTQAKTEGFKIVGMISREEHIVVMEREGARLP